MWSPAGGHKGRPYRVAEAQADGLGQITSKGQERPPWGGGPYARGRPASTYHGAGATFLPNVPKYATENAVEFSKTGGGKALIDNFTAAFGKAFDSSVHEITNVIGEGNVTIGGIDFVIRQTDDAFDIEIPEINAVYTHMLGHDCHSIVAGSAHADGIVAELESYISRGFDLILTSHYTPEDLKDAETKIAYLENLKKIAASCSDADGFKAEVKKQYPEYSGENYLDMTAGFFFA